MKKIMLAVGHKLFEEELIKKLKDQYSFTGIATYREAILGEAVRHNPDIIVIRENLAGSSNISDIVYSLREKVPSARIILISTDRQAGDEFLATLVAYGVYDIIVGTKINLSSLVDLIKKPNTFSDISMYAAKVSVDEKGNKKVFETKIIQAPTPAPVPAEPQQAKSVKPILAPPPQPKKKEMAPVIDEDIPLPFGVEPPRIGELKIQDNNKGNLDIKYDDTFYSPDDYLTRTSKPVKIHGGVDFKEEKSIPTPKAVIVQPVVEEFDFEIVDENGNPIQPNPAPVVENPKASSDVKPFIDDKLDDLLSFEPAKPVVKEEVFFEPEIPVIPEIPKEDKVVEFEHPIVEKTESKILEQPVNPHVEEPTEKPTERAVEKPVEKPVVNETKKPIADKLFRPQESREVQKPFVKLEEATSETLKSKRNKWFNAHPVDVNTKTLLFVRVEQYAENHSALNVAIRLAKDNHSTLFVSSSEKSSLDYFTDSLTGSLNSLTVKKLSPEFTMIDVLSYIKANPVAYIVVDSYIGDDWKDWLLMSTHRFMLMKQNKPWVQSVLRVDPKLSYYAKFFVLTLEEYTEFGISPKVLMNDCRPLGVIKIKDKKEGNFYALNAKMPMMMSKKNEETIEAYRELINYIYEKGDELSD